MAASSDSPHLDAVADPEHVAGASYAVDPARARQLTALIRADGTETRRGTSPLTGQAVADIPLSTQADVDAAFADARTAQGSWAETDLHARSRVLLDLHDLVLDRQREVLDLIQYESGKARKHAFDEILHVALTARYYGRTLKRHLNTRRHPGVYPVLTRAEVNRVPKGVVGIISPWNYPYTLALADGLPAIAAGNAVVHKPDSQTPLTALAGVELLREAGLPPGLWQPVYGPGAVIGGAIIDRADYVCFTGSTATGRTVAAKAAERLIGCSLELGGKNPMLVLADADVERAAEGAVRAAFSSAGQLCVSMERIFVSDAVYDRFVERFVARVRAMELSTELSFDADMGALISEQQLRTVEDHVADAVANGATVLAGGRARPDVGPLFYEPTVLEGVTPQMRCFADETFGPVVSLYRFTAEADAVARANDGAYGLNASIYSRDVKRARALARRIRCGTVNINEGFAATFASTDTPMGGMRESGLGRRQGAEGIHRYTEPQSVADQRLLPLAAPRFLSEERYARAMTGALRVLKRTRRA
ncbi:MAG: succinic semialdehyde dehydrogenase [Nocardioidaceae bacterium]